MNQPEIITKRELNISETIDLKKLFGKIVLASTGFEVGHVSQLRLNASSRSLEGVVTKKIFHKPIYVGVSYIAQINEKSVILNMEPSVFLINRKIINYEGKILGKIVKIKRKNNTNEVENVTIHSFLKKDTEIASQNIDKIGKNIILKKNYNVKQNYIWQRA